MSGQGPFITRKPLILASGSPRRRRYFHDLGLDFTVREANVAEARQPGEQPVDFVKRMAVEKARTIMQMHPDSWVVAADTVVFFSDRILGKPQNPDEAVTMLMHLSGRRHCVQTGFCIGCRREGVEIIDAVMTQVDFAEFPEELARAYVATGEPLDKAGAYGIQGRGAVLVKAVSGSYSNVVGLPLHEVTACLFRHGVIEVA